MLPADYLQLLVATFDSMTLVLCPDHDRMLKVWPEATWRAHLPETGSGTERRRARRAMASEACVLAPDAKRQISIPPALRQTCGLGDKVELVGGEGFLAIVAAAG